MSNTDGDGKFEFDFTSIVFFVIDDEPQHCRYSTNGHQTIKNHHNALKLIEVE